MEQLLRRPVVIHGIEMGRPYDVVFDVAASRAVGLDVECGDTRHRFLPFPAARVREHEIAIGSALVLLPEEDVGFYRLRGRTFRSLVGTPVERDGVAQGELVDVVLAADGAVEAVAVSVAGSVTLVPAGPSLTIGVPGSASAA